jgi:hypothetical protein
MALSVFEDKSSPPTAEMVKDAIGIKYEDWKAIIAFVMNNHKGCEEIWNFAGKAFGWSLRIKDAKRVIIYLTPGNNRFLLSMVYGKKATEEALKSNIPEKIKSTIENAKVYAEGRGFRIEVNTDTNLADLIKLVEIKLKN